MAGCPTSLTGLPSLLRRPSPFTQREVPLQCAKRKARRAGCLQQRTLGTGSRWLRSLPSTARDCASQRAIQRGHPHGETGALWVPMRTHTVLSVPWVLMVFSEEADARRVHEVLPKRFGRDGLKLHPEKWLLVGFQRPRPKAGARREATFDFLGFTLLWGRSRRGSWARKVRTAKGRLTRSPKARKE